MTITIDASNLDEVLKEVETNEEAAIQCVVATYIGKLLRNGRMVNERETNG